MGEVFEPNIVVFACNWCSYAGMDLAGTSRIQYPSNLKVIRVMCSGRINPVFILEAFASGADGVLVTGCHPGDCHYISGNYKTRKRVMLLEKLLEQFGIEKGRLRLEWVSASEGERFASIAREFVEQIRKLGPNRISEELRKEVALV
ncbi:MAG: methyl-viologen-reducing hydrogenase subunit delta [Candidatus Terraquivivens tikiterensis]|uniref:Methyl-viologen-reducing hydrogenase subunit delta n=1 Tax=Candidatus Terraquivivens tikiterensis TaxID=1980982 RepID=A0A2R7Y9P3_9ARCH|nr:MAG: methyl-viologen-reducing hydrogenase subunit delta [Candidatus Terraquivivens tikiterensis]